MSETMAVWIATGISILTLFLSVSISLLSAGLKVGKIEEKLIHMATKEEMQAVKETLAEIKGMFTLRLKDLP